MFSDYIRIKTILDIDNSQNLVFCVFFIENVDLDPEE